MFISQSLATHKAPMGDCQSVPAVTSPVLWTDCETLSGSLKVFFCFLSGFVVAVQSSYLVNSAAAIV